MLRAMFESRRRLALSAGVATALAFGLGIGISTFVRTTSDDVGLNFVLIVVWVTVMMASGSLQALLVANLLWGDRWRRRTLLGWQPSVDEIEPDDLTERGWMLYALFGILVGLNYGGHAVASGNFFGWYQFRGFSLVQVRSPDPAQRLEGISELADHDDDEIVDVIRTMVSDPDLGVRAEAMGVMGDKKVESARSDLFRALEGSDDGVRSVAAEALGKVRGEGVLQALAGLLSRGGSPALRRGALAGLGLLRNRDAAGVVLGYLADEELEDETRAVAAWAVGELKPPGAQERLLDVIDNERRDLTRCAGLHALAKVLDGRAAGVPERLKAAFSSGRGQEGFACPRAFVTPRARARCFGKLNRPMDGPYEGPCIQYQISSPEKLRVKMVRAVARAAGKQSLRWLAEAANDTEEPMAVRFWAADLFKQLDGR